MFILLTNSKSVDADQNYFERSSIIRVCTISYFICLYWKYFTALRPIYCNFMMMTVIFYVSEN